MTSPDNIPPEDFQHPPDPYPKMILVVIGITVVLFFLIFSMLLLDFTNSNRRTRPVLPEPAPMQMPTPEQTNTN